MNEQELKELLPFFVAGTLSAGQEAEVQRGLAASEQLRRELRFWRQAEAAVRARSEHAAAGHLTARDLVDRAMGLTTGERMLAVDRHLQSCPHCSEEFLLITQSIDQAGTMPQPSGRRFAVLSKYLRPVYIVPAALAVIAAAMVILRNQEEPLPSSEIPIISPPSIVAVPEDAEDTAEFSVSYRSHMRSAAPGDIPVMVLDKHHTRISLTAAIPHNAIEGVRYRVALEGADGRVHIIQERAQQFASGEPYDSLRCVFPRTQLPASDGTVTLRITEILPLSIKNLSPESYAMAFSIRIKE